MQTQNKFQISDLILEKNLFTPERAKYGPKTYINTNYLPNFYQYLKLKLTDQQKKCMVEYEVQTLLLEISMQNYKKIKNLRQFTNFILDLIICNPKYWIKNSEVWKEAVEKDLEIQKQIEEEQNKFQMGFESQQDQDNDNEQDVENQSQNVDLFQKQSNNTKVIQKQEQGNMEQIEQDGQVTIEELFQRFPVQKNESLDQQEETKHQILSKIDVLKQADQTTNENYRQSEQIQESEQQQKQINDNCGSQENEEEQKYEQDEQQIFAEQYYQDKKKIEQELGEQNVKQILEYQKYNQEMKNYKKKYEFSQEDDLEHIQIESDYWDQVDLIEKYWEKQFKEGPYKNLFLHRKMQQYSTISIADSSRSTRFKEKKIQEQQIQQDLLLQQQVQVTLKQKKQDEYRDLLIKDELKTKTIFVQDKFNRYSKLEHFLFPYIYQYIVREVVPNHEICELLIEKCQFKLQNFIMNLIYTGIQPVKKTKSKKPIFAELEEMQKFEEQEKEQQLKNQELTKSIIDFDENSSKKNEDSNENTSSIQQSKQRDSSTEKQQNDEQLANKNNNQSQSEQASKLISQQDMTNQNSQMDIEEDDSVQQSSNQNSLQQDQEDNDTEANDENSQRGGSYSYFPQRKHKSRGRKIKDQSQYDDSLFQREEMQRYLFIENCQILSKFSKFLKENQFIMLNFFSCGMDAFRKEVNLIRNTIQLSLCQVRKNYEQQEQENELKNKVADDLNASTGFMRKKELRNTAKKFLNKDNPNYIEILVNLEKYDALKEKEVEQIVQFYIDGLQFCSSDSLIMLDNYTRILIHGQRSGIIGCFSSKEHIQLAIEQYQQYINDPITLKKQHYRFHSENRKEWSEEEYRKFQKGLLEFFDIPINNKKIAKFIGDDINPNHVRYIKCAYLKSLKNRGIKNGITRKQQLERDIENFDMSLFQNNGKGKKKESQQSNQSPNRSEDSDQSDYPDDFNDIEQQEKYYNQANALPSIHNNYNKREKHSDSQQEKQGNTNNSTTAQNYVCSNFPMSLNHNLAFSDNYLQFQKKQFFQHSQNYYEPQKLFSQSHTSQQSQHKKQEDLQKQQFDSDNSQQQQQQQQRQPRIFKARTPKSNINYTTFNDEIEEDVPDDDNFDSKREIILQEGLKKKRGRPKKLNDPDNEIQNQIKPQYINLPANSQSGANLQEKNIVPCSVIRQYEENQSFNRIAKISSPSSSSSSCSGSDASSSQKNEDSD